MLDGAMALEEELDCKAAAALNLLSEVEADADILTGLLSYFEEGSHEYKTLQQRIKRIETAIAKVKP